MRIGVDAHILGKGKGGVERYVAELCTRLPNLAPDHSLYFFINKNYVPKEQPANVTWVPLKISDPLIQRSIILPWLIRKLRLDVIHTQRIAPLWSNCPVVVSIHDILPLTSPDDYQGLRHNIIRTLTGWTASHAKTIITVSHSVKKQIEKKLPAARGKIETIYNGVDHLFFKPSSQQNKRPIAEDYLLYTGAIEPRKNLHIVLEAYAQICNKHEKKLSLVLVGMDRDKEYAIKLRQKSQKNPKTGHIIFTGFLDEKKALHYLQNASIFLAPSRGEGFDLPPLEAMACNIPVICSDIEVHRELFNEAALFFQADSAQDLARTILTLYKNNDLATKLQRQGIACAAQFSWGKTICQIVKIYKKTGQRKQQ